MHLIRSLANLKPLEQGCVATVGNFDGVHRGHQFIIHNLASQGRRLGLPVIVVLFEPQPREYFQPELAPARLTRLREKVAHLAELPIDMILLLRFNRAFAEQEPEDFIQKTLVERLHVKYLVVGDDFRFGKGRRGDFAMLKKAGQTAGFEVENTCSFQIDNQRVSSTLIRCALESGNLEMAKQLLGRPYSICGRVVPGSKRGRLLGFPTANIKVDRKNAPINGVFAVMVSGIAQGELPGVANVGTRPTVEDGQRVLLEAHLFGFDQDIYGRYVEVHFHKKIRDEKKFASLEALRLQIQQDVQVAEKILASQD